MTTEEAIKRLKEHMDRYDMGRFPNTSFTKALNMAVAALRAQADVERNEPLTLEELREMGGEPVYIVRPVVGEAWWIVIHGVTKEKLTTDYGGWFDITEYGKTWLAYRRKPEAGEDINVLTNADR